MPLITTILYVYDVMSQGPLLLISLVVGIKMLNTFVKQIFVGEEIKILNILFLFSRVFLEKGNIIYDYLYNFICNPIPLPFQKFVFMCPMKELFSPTCLG